MTNISRVPQWVINLIAPEFSPVELEIIATNWYRYWQGSLTNSEKVDFVNTGHAILWLVGYKTPSKHLPSIVGL